MAGDARKWRGPIPACPTCNEDADLCPHDQERDMTSPTQRRHDEILGRLDALINAVQSTTARDHLHRLLAEESAAERRDEPVDVTEEPPVGSQVTDGDGDVWERLERGWVVVAFEGSVSTDVEHEVGRTWDFTRTRFGPLRLTTDADRERVGLPVEGCPTCTGSTRETVGMVCQTCGTDYARDVDPDEALARAIWEAAKPPNDRVRDWSDTEGHHAREEALRAARAAREHIEWEVSRERDSALARATKAEADVERLTRERDEAVRDVRTAERQTTEQQARYEALWDDVDRTMVYVGLLTRRLRAALDRDDRRAK